MILLFLIRLDWNLLSTASPAINAWLNPSNRFAKQVVRMVRSMYRRSTAIVACLMTEALDVQGIHIPMKVIAAFVAVDSVAISTTAATIATAVHLHRHHHHHQNPSTSENIRNPHKSLPSQLKETSYNHHHHHCCRRRRHHHHHHHHHYYY